MVCRTCFDLPGVWMVTPEGIRISPCPACGSKVARSARETPQQFCLEIARQVVAENPASSDDEIARLIYERTKSVRVVVDNDGDNSPCDR